MTANGQISVYISRGSGIFNLRYAGRTIRFFNSRQTDMTLYNPAFFYSPNPSLSDEYTKKTVVHELAHVWDFAQGGVLSVNMGARVLSSRLTNDRLEFLRGYLGENVCPYIPGGGKFNIERPASIYARNSVYEDWAEAVAATVYPDWEQFFTRERVNDITTETRSIRWNGSVYSKTRLGYVKEKFSEFKNR